MPRVPLLTHFICGSTLLTGAKTIGYAQVIVNGLQTILYMYMIISFAEQQHRIGNNAGVSPTMMKLIAAVYFEALCGIVLLFGIYWDKASYIKAWVLIQWGLMVQNAANVLIFLLLCLLGYSTLLMEFVLTKFIGLILDVYYTLVVYSFYRKTYYRDSYGNLLYDEVIDSLE